MIKSVVVTVVTVLALMGCSSTPTAAPEAPAKQSAEVAQTVAYDESSILYHLNATEGVFTTESGTECEISVVLTDASMVSTYADAGDNVASTPSGSAGVKISSPEAATCNEAITVALQDLE